MLMSNKNKFLVSGANFQPDEIIANVTAVTLCFARWNRSFHRNKSQSWALSFDPVARTCNIGKAWFYDLPPGSGEEVLEIYIHLGIENAKVQILF